MGGVSEKSDLPANADTTMYTVPADTIATVNVSLCNRTSGEIAVRLAVKAGALANSDYLEYDVLLPPNTPLERTAITMTAGEAVVCRAAAAGVSARVHGVAEAVN